MNDLVMHDVSVCFHLPHTVVQAVKHVSLTCRAGQITGLIGESGSGKSVLGMSVLGLLGPTAQITGSIGYRARDMLALTEDEYRVLRGSEIAFIPQNPRTAFDPLRKVGEQITEPLMARGMAKAEARERMLTRLAELGFDDPRAVAASYSFELSGGMAQRALCALGTIQRPQWLIADEPTKGLDAILRQQVATIFRKLRCEGVSMLMVTHDLHLAEALCDRIAVLRDGTIVEEGPAAELFARPQTVYMQMLLAARPDVLAAKRNEVAYGNA